MVLYDIMYCMKLLSADGTFECSWKHVVYRFSMMIQFTLKDTSPCGNEDWWPSGWLAFQWLGHNNQKPTSNKSLAHAHEGGIHVDMYIESAVIVEHLQCHETRSSAKTGRSLHIFCVIGTVSMYRQRVKKEAAWAFPNIHPISSIPSGPRGNLHVLGLQPCIFGRLNSISVHYLFCRRFS